MIDKVVVTIHYMEHNRILYTADLELSANVFIDELEDTLLEALRKERRDLFMSVQSIQISTKEIPDIPISKDETLASSGIWDGRELIIRRRN